MDEQYGKKLKHVLTAAKCPKCGTMYHDLHSSIYICPNCGYEEPTNFGIVREYLEEHGNASAIEISRDTGISIREINSFLRNGKLEIPEDSPIFISCKRCGADLRYGKYCPNCAAELKKELKGAFDTTTIGAVPRGVMQGKMHTLNQLRDRR